LKKKRRKCSTFTFYLRTWRETFYNFILFLKDTARELTKSMMRNETINKLIAHREQDLDNFVEFTQKDSIQKSIGAYLESVKRRSSPKKE
jgi:hypothetical protein